MKASDIQARVVGATSVVALDGELDRRQAAVLRPRLLEAAAPDTVALLLDLGAVTYLDSAGVHLLLDLDRELRGRGQALHLVRPRRRTPAYVLEVTGIGEGIAVHDDLAAALAVVEPADS